MAARLAYRFLIVHVNGAHFLRVCGSSTQYRSSHKPEARARDREEARQISRAILLLTLFAGVMVPLGLIVDDPNAFAVLMAIGS